MTDWRAVLLNLLVRNPHAELDYPEGDYLAPFMEVLREAEAEAEARYAVLREEFRKTEEQRYRGIVAAAKPAQDAMRAKFGRPPVDVDAEVAKLMRQ